MLSHCMRMFSMLGFCLLSAIPCFAQSPALSPAKYTQASLAEMRQAVAQASAHRMPWNGPETGPAAKPGATVAVVCEDLRNGGILGVAKGVSEASKVIGWKVMVYDAGGTPEGRSKALQPHRLRCRTA